MKKQKTTQKDGVERRNGSGLCVVALSKNLKLTTTHSGLLRKTLVSGSTV